MRNCSVLDRLAAAYRESPYREVAMDLLVIRHGMAEEKEEFARTGLDDDLRPLTREGREKMARIAEGLRTVVPEITLLATSPLERARQTAKIVAVAYGARFPVAVTDALAPDRRYEDFLEWLRAQDVSGTVAVVGHEPHLGGLVTWLLTGGDESRTPLKKGGACLLELGAAPGKAMARLVWMLTPSIARKL